MYVIAAQQIRIRNSKKREREREREMGNAPPGGLPGQGKDGVMMMIRRTQEVSDIMNHPNHL